MIRIRTAGNTGVRGVIVQFMREKDHASFIYSGEKADVPRYRESFGIETVLIDPERTFMNISGRQIRQAPFRYWDPFRQRLNLLCCALWRCSASPAVKSTLVNKLANMFNTTSARNTDAIMCFPPAGDEIGA